MHTIRKITTALIHLKCTDSNIRASELTQPADATVTSIAELNWIDLNIVKLTNFLDSVLNKVNSTKCCKEHG